jgi:hypothetical protein
MVPTRRIESLALLGHRALPLDREATYTGARQRARL